ncbi:MAG: prefoldin subunit alpha [Methanosphaera sp.]|uniref:prefoldin subunit alpha n=1 Tax=Methanosphaera sp. TaxID=2666342 RepID=UPI0025DE29EE|nr:prefoldin subunit alpha [Methanosphaera sp.]MCI5867863.1 prefoldin subunit alpha [Methanosphaera sp.]MDD6534873.1 prefoldin subunit alpha [Methanosphaera sp.]MDY3955333.1 prefoldin subunit alpha [Methanosphaera sp.]
MEDRQKLEKMVAELNQLQQQGEAIAKQLEQLNMSLADIRSATDALKGIEGKVGEEVLLPIGAGCFIDAEIKSDDVILGVGADVAIKKSAQETIETLTKETKDVESLIKSLTEQLTKINEVIAKQRPEAERLMQQAEMQQQQMQQ